MKLNISFFDSVININSGRISILSIQDPKIFGMMVHSFHSLINKTDSPYLVTLLDDKDKPIPVSQVDFITDIYSVDYKSKKIQNALQERIQSILNFDIELNTNIQNLIIQIEEELLNNRFPNVLPIHSNIDWDSGILMKAFSLCVESNLQEDNHLNRMKLYIDVACELNICSIIVFTNVASILSKEEFKELCCYALIRDVIIVCLEQSMAKNYLNEYCYGLLIDEDYDEFDIVKGEIILV